MSIAYVGGAVGGALVSSMNSSSPSGQTTTTGTSSPWIGQQPYLTQGFQNTQNWYNNGGTQVAPLNQMQNQSFGMAQQNANNPTLQAANTSNQAFSNGSMMNNPYLSQMVNAADDSITRNYQSAIAPGIQSNSEANGRYGSGAMLNQQSQAQQNLATQLGNTNANIYGNSYQSGLNNMLTANGQSAGLNQAGLSNISALNAAGNQQQQYQQALNQQPLQNLQNYQGLINGNFGNQTTSSNPYYTNQNANMLGGALAGAQLVNAYQGNGNPSASQSAYNNSQANNAGAGGAGGVNSW
jgi:hypothetical protein